ncbi:hypothetical protein ACOSQ4_015772 [Xanthoceras sorbifolium]
MFLPHVKLQIGDGRRVRFWADVWRGEAAFYELFPHLYRLSAGHNLPVIRYEIGNEAERGWDLILSRNLGDRDAEECAGLLLSLEGVTLLNREEDRRLWILKE